MPSNNPFHEDSPADMSEGGLPAAPGGSASFSPCDDPTSSATGASPHMLTPDPSLNPTNATSDLAINLVVVLDGTANQFGLHNSNCVELYSHLEKTPLQRTYYNSGIGTYINPHSHSNLSISKQRLLNVWDMFTAYRLKSYIVSAYRWLSDHYSPGSRIFLFGFSRGAYEVRALAAMLHKVGLIHTGNEEQIDFAYELFADPGSANLAATFKATFSRDVSPVHFVGVWDTVSSVGLFRKKVLPGVSDTTNVRSIRHAVSLDERRVKFQPELYHTLEGAPIPNVKEIWFAGCHSDIGGGNRANADLLLGDVPLIWMEWEAMQAGLHISHMAPKIWDFKSLPQQGKIESLKGWYWLMELWHRGKGRQVPMANKLHSSVLLKLSKDVYEKSFKESNPSKRYALPNFIQYIPAAFTPRAVNWLSLRQHIGEDHLADFHITSSDIVEADLLDDSLPVLTSLADNISATQIRTTLRTTSIARLVYVCSHSEQARRFLVERSLTHILIKYIDQWKLGDRLQKAPLHALWYLAIDNNARKYLLSEQSLYTITVWLKHGGIDLQWAGVSLLRELVQCQPYIPGPRSLRKAITSIPESLLNGIVVCLRKTADEIVQLHAIGIIIAWIKIAAPRHFLCYQQGLVKVLLCIAKKPVLGQSAAISAMKVLAEKEVIGFDTSDLADLRRLKARAYPELRWSQTIDKLLDTIIAKVEPIVNAIEQDLNSGMAFPNGSEIPIEVLVEEACCRS